MLGQCRDNVLILLLNVRLSVPTHKSTHIQLGLMRWLELAIHGNESSIPNWCGRTCSKGLGAESEEKPEPASDIDTGAVDGLKVLEVGRARLEREISSARRPRARARTRGH
jgi:hypothetical protein